MVATFSTREGHVPASGSDVWYQVVGEGDAAPRQAAARYDCRRSCTWHLKCVS